MVTRSAFERVIRTLAFSVGLGGIVFTLLGLPAIIEQYSFLNQTYSIVAIALFCGLPAVMAAIAFRTSARVLRVMAGIHAGSTVLLLALWVPAMTIDRIPNAQLPWLINMIAVATCMAAIAGPFFSAWVYLFGLTTMCGFVRYLTVADVTVSHASIAFQDSVMIVLISGFMLALLQLTQRAGREQDAAALEAQVAAAEQAALETLERQRTRYHAFTHDDVLATLLAASQDGEYPSDVTRRSAQRTLEKLDQFRLDLPVPTYLTAAELDAHLRATATSIGVPLHSTLASEGAPEPHIPLEVADALTEALSEAMRNSVRHSAHPDGRPVERFAYATFDAATIEIVMHDDGRGFNPNRVSIDRLGVRLSILQRVNSQAGGEATIRSAKGAGTTVTLRWTAADEL